MFRRVSTEIDVPDPDPGVTYLVLERGGRVLLDVLVVAVLGVVLELEGQFDGANQTRLQRPQPEEQSCGHTSRVRRRHHFGCCRVVVGLWGRRNTTDIYTVHERLRACGARVRSADPSGIDRADREEGENFAVR